MEDQRKKKTVEWRGEKSGISAESEANTEDRAFLLAWRNWCSSPPPSYCLQCLPWGSVYVKAQPGSLTYTARTHSSKNGERKSSCDHGTWEGKTKSQEFEVFLCNRVSRRLGNNRLHLKKKCMNLIIQQVFNKCLLYSAKCSSLGLGSTRPTITKPIFPSLSS